MNRPLATVTSCLLLVSIQASLPHLQAQEASRADFVAFKDAVVGRWVGNITLNADYSGVAKKGEKITAYVVFETSNDGQTLTARFAGGKGSGTWTIAYDSGEKRIRTLWSTSGGDFDQAIIYRQADRWVEEGEGTTPEGKVAKFKNTLTISDGGNTHTWTGTSSRDGIPNEPRNDVYRRVASEVPQGAELLQEYGDLAVGRWKGKVVLINDWPGIGKRGDTVESSRSVRWAIDKHALVVKEHLATGVSTTLYTWNPISKSIDVLHASVGGSTKGSLAKLANGDWIETIESGGTVTGEFIGGAVVRRFSKDGTSFKCYGIVTSDGKALDELQDVYEKVSP